MKLSQHTIKDLIWEKQHGFTINREQLTQIKQYVIDTKLQVGTEDVTIDSLLQIHFQKEWSEAQDIINNYTRIMDTLKDEKHYDKNGVEIKKGMYVEVPEPDETDIHNFAFTGFVVGFRHGNVQVRDDDEDVFEIEPERLLFVDQSCNPLNFL